MRQQDQNQPVPCHSEPGGARRAKHGEENSDSRIGKAEKLLKI